jgi:sialate O-acetylesterase
MKKSLFATLSLRVTRRHQYDKKHTGVRAAAILLCIYCLPGFAQAAIKLPPLVGDNMVLQRNSRTPVWGWAAAGATIEITFHNNKYNAVADASGKWMVKLNALTAGGPYDMTIQGDGSLLTIKNILIGDVWICSGQSNMVFDFNNGRAKVLYAKDIETSANDQIRQLIVNRAISDQPAASFASNGWKMAAPQTLNAFSAAAYFFARDLYEQYHVPIGLINTSWGGTKAEAWTSEEALTSFPQFGKDIQLLHDTAQVNAKRRATAQRIAEWKEKARMGDTPATKIPGPYNPQDMATSIYNGMVAPLIPYAIKGVIWYQGENNAGRGREYRTLFPNMIKDWRTRWQLGDFPFIFQQLVNYKAVSKDPGESQWAELREAQLMTLSNTPNTAMAVGIDIGEANDIHPVDKKDVGIRLALAARKLAYREKKLVSSGPLYESMKQKDNAIIIRFNNTGSGLITKDGQPLKYFAIAGEDKKFVWAEAVIKGNTIEVSSPAVSKPVAVRYAWADNPESVNFFNKEGLPASPFRTDDWQLVP